MRFLTMTFLLAAVLAAVLVITGVCSARNNSEPGCVSFAEAGKHVGANQCVRGTVLRVENGGKGATFLNFCKDKPCLFTVVVFPADLKKMGDVRQLEGRQIEIKGTIQDHGGRAEIVLRRSQQLGDAAFLLFPRVPTDYDVQRRGRNSVGSMERPKAAKKSSAKQDDPVSIEDPGEPK